MVESRAARVNTNIPGEEEKNTLQFEKNSRKVKKRCKVRCFREMVEWVYHFVLQLPSSIYIITVENVE